MTDNVIKEADNTSKEKSATIWFDHIDKGTSVFPMADTEPPTHFTMDELGISTDNLKFALNYDEFVAESGADAMELDSRISYLFRMFLSGDSSVLGPLPPSSVPLEMTFQGYVDIDSGVNGKLLIVIGDQVYAREFQGPMNDNYRFVITYPVPLNAIALDGKDRISILLVASIDRSQNIWRSGLLTLDWIDGEIAELHSEEPWDERKKRLRKRRVRDLPHW